MRSNAGKRSKSGARRRCRRASRSCRARAGVGGAARRHGRAPRSAPGSTAFARDRSQNAGEDDAKRGMRRRRAPGRSTSRQAIARTTTDARLRPNADDDPAPVDEVEGVVDGVPVGPAPPESTTDERNGARDRPLPEPRDPASRHAATAPPQPGARRPLVDAAQPPRDVRPGIALDARAAAPRRRALRGAARRQAARRPPRRAPRGRPGGTATDVSARHHVAVPRDVGSDDRQRARERAREHHPEALAAERRRHERLGRRELRRQLVLAAGSRARRSRRPDTRRRVSSSRTASGSAPQIRSRGSCARVDLRPRAQEHLQPLSRLLAAGEDDRVLPPARLGVIRDQDAVRDDLVLARSQRAADARACSETAIRWSTRSIRKPQHVQSRSRIQPSSPRRVVVTTIGQSRAPARRRRASASSARADAARRSALAPAPGGSGRSSAG